MRASCLKEAVRIFIFMMFCGLQVAIARAGESDPQSVIDRTPFLGQRKC
jgi:hypothetical protein